MSILVSSRPIANAIALTCQLTTPVSDIARAIADSEMTRYHFELFIRDITKMSKTLKGTGAISGSGTSHFVYNEETFRPLFPVMINGQDIGAYVAFLDQAPSRRRESDLRYNAKIWLRDSQQARKFVREHLHTGLHRSNNTDGWLAIFDKATMRLNNVIQNTECVGAILDN